ncbi:AMP-binding protein [Streptomyces sp. NA04227]|uniref:AMP-binding protein n=1 Tax=Streptomyces sp. NA04227 TaxID=2742136 RepID=UPI0015926BF7|nr:AMP-binding protein [Streptomyces sp. NA04227]QKW07642.1 AMP-binding protein [Streptomyces sp. NA04227]
MGSETRTASGTESPSGNGSPLSSLFAAVIDRAAEARRGLSLLHQARLFDPLRPDRSLRFGLDSRRLGPMTASLRGAVDRHPDAVGLIDERGELTYAELDARSDALATAWRADGIADRAVIGLLCRDHRGLFDVLFAAAKSGARLLLLNTGFAGPQLADVVKREGVQVVVYDEEFEDVVTQLPDDVVRFLAWTEDEAAAAPYPRIEELITDTAPGRLPQPSEVGTLVLLTSGTTGVPKGAPRQVKGPKFVVQLLDRVPWQPGERTLISSPLFHATGLAHAGLAVSLGSAIVVQRRFDALGAVRTLAEHRCTGMVLVPTMLHRMVALGPKTLAEYDLSRVRIMLSAGAPLAPALVHGALDAFGDVLYNLYGSTEVALATVAQPHELRASPTTAGRPLVGCDVGLYDEEGHRLTGADRRGRVFVGNGMKFGGYTDGRTKQEIDGLMSTGDMGHFDTSGLLFLDGRDDDMVLCGGENVFPGEVENLLWTHEDITEAAVIGVDHPEFGTRLAAFVVLAPGAELTEEDVREHVRSHLARHKVPAQVLFVDELPRNPTGKLLRGAAREVALRESRAAPGEEQGQGQGEGQEQEPDGGGAR